MSALTDRATMQSGTRTGRVLAHKYRLLGTLGKGGMGEVYAAEHTFVKRRFAVKFLHEEFARDEQMIARFRREAQAAGSLENENIVAVTDFGYAEGDGTPFIVMEYLVGEDLRSLLMRTGRLSIQRAVDLVMQACRGVHAAHVRGFVHRDLKPQNLFITKRGDNTELVKVLDFGIAKLRGMTTSGESTKAGSVIGTLLYMPPEQLRGEKDIDHRADIYALGGILYETLTGSVPHPSDEAHTIMYKILYERPVPVMTLRPDVPAALAAVIEQALASDANDRFQSAAALLDALAPFSARQMTPLETPTTVGLSVTLPVADDAPRRAAIKARAIGLSATAILLALLVFAVIRFLDEAPQTPVPVARPIAVPSNTAAPIASSPDKTGQRVHAAERPSDGAAAPRGSGGTRPEREELDLGEVFPK